MSNGIIIRVADLIGSSSCISAEDGQKVFNTLVPFLKSRKEVIISFERISTLISLFLNVAIGQLYGVFSENEIRALIKVDGLACDDLEILKRVVENAKKYYANPKGYDAAWHEEEDTDDQ